MSNTPLGCEAEADIDKNGKYNDKWTIPNMIHFNKNGHEHHEILVKVNFPKKFPLCRKCKASFLDIKAFFNENKITN